jgi:hypothetical protein
MTVYILAQLTITDRAKYDRYQARFMEVFKPFGGTVLSVDDSVHVIEGDWPHSRFVLRRSRTNLVPRLVGLARLPPNRRGSLGRIDR